MGELQSPSGEKEMAESISVLSTPTRIGSLYDGNKNRRRSQMFQRQVADASFTNMDSQNNNNQDTEDAEIDDEEFEEEENLASHVGGLGQDLLDYEVPYSSVESVTEKFSTMSVRGKRSSNDNEVDKLKREKLNYQLQLRLLSEFARKVIETCEHGEEIKQDLINKLENEFLLFNPHCEHCEEKSHQVEKLEKANVELDTELRAIIDSFESQQEEVHNLIQAQKSVNKVINSIMGLFKDEDESDFSGLTTDEKLDQLFPLLEAKINAIKDEKDKQINELTIKLKSRESGMTKNEESNNNHVGEQSFEPEDRIDDHIQSEAERIAKLEALLAEATTRETNLNTEKNQLNEKLNHLASGRDNAVFNQKNDTAWRSYYLQACKLNIDAFSKFITSFNEILDGESINEAVSRIKRLQSLTTTSPNHAKILSITSSILRYFNVAIKTIVDQHSQLLLREANPIDDQVHQLQEDNSTLEQHVQSFIDQSSTVDELARMRIEELTKKWKNEREARSYENEQARRRLKEVESENDKLKIIIASMRKE
ncbi:BA75_03846T0 [Komagataella pastoris]|uniref:BA75_03846T0 n=1 Tax=Komagataella pastoris TaxID=4922 RepID=A0A1B2JGP1_PICPA|nr:BA75_03846T0 [Komagataella pastoris]